MSDLKSINEPATTRQAMLTPQSINEPLVVSNVDIPVPIITAIEPTEATIGDASFMLYVTGENFLHASTIIFAERLEPTTLNEDGRLSTGIDMNFWHGSDSIPVAVMNGEKTSNEVIFTFHPDGGARLRDPDELEEEIEEAEEEGDFKPMHRGPKRRKR